MKGGYVYIMTNKPQGTLYVGVTLIGGCGSIARASSTGLPSVTA